MMEFRITFPHRYRVEPHPVVDGADPDGWLAVIADDFRAAWELLTALTGCQWNGMFPADEMPEEEWRFCFPRGEIARWVQPSRETRIAADEMLRAVGLGDEERAECLLPAAVWLEGWQPRRVEEVA